jgi:hypothetical protein
MISPSRANEPFVAGALAFRVSFISATLVRIRYRNDEERAGRSLDEKQMHCVHIELVF